MLKLNLLKNLLIVSCLGLFVMSCEKTEPKKDVKIELDQKDAKSVNVTIPAAAPAASPTGVNIEIKK